MSSELFGPLRKLLKHGHVLLPSDKGFSESLCRWSATCEKLAAAVAFPKTAEEVSGVIRFATDNGIAFNVRGGGHSTSQSSSAPSPEGMVIDLGLMRDVKVNELEQTVTFGGGCLWKEVDDALWQHGLATVGGTVSHTGVGGLIIHGGFGILSGVHGLASDVLDSCKVVLADGRIITCSLTENEDLFWAIRGAGSSFGIVTEFTSKAFPQGPIWGGMAIFTPDKLGPLLDFVNRWAEDNDGTQNLGIGFTLAPRAPDSPADTPRLPVITVQMIHVGKDAKTQGPEYFAEILNMDAVTKQAGPMPYPQANQEADLLFPAGKRYLLGAGNFTTPLALHKVEVIRDKFMRCSTARPELCAEDSILVFEALPNGKRCSISTSDTAFNSRGDYYNVLVAWAWTNPDADLVMREYNRKIVRELRQAVGYDDEQLRDGVGRYINYESHEISAEHAFGSHAARLRELKAKYDSRNIFDKIWKL